MKKQIFLMSLLIFLLAGCGIYTFKGSVPGHLKTIAIPPFENQTAEFDLAETITDKLIDEFTSDNTLKVRDLDEGDLVVYGRITRLADRPSTFNSDESVEEYKVTVTVHVRVHDTIMDKVMWEENISNFGIYPYTGGNSEERQDGIDEATKKIVEDIINKTVAGW